MQLSGFAGCCGASIIHGLNGITLAQLNTRMKNLPTSYAMAITSSGQIDAVTVLKKAGFQQLSQFRSASSGSTLTVYGRTKVAVAKQPKRKPNLIAARRALQTVIASLGD